MTASGTVLFVTIENVVCGQKHGCKKERLAVNASLSALQDALAVTTSMGPTASTVEPSTAVETASPAVESTTAAVEAASAVIPTTVESVNTVEPFTTVKSSAITAPDISAFVATAIAPTRAAVPITAPTGMTVPRTTIPPISPAPLSQPSGTVKPRASPDEHSTNKPVRTVIPIRGACVWVISIVSVLTDRRAASIAIGGSNPNSHADLGLRITQWQRQY